MLFRSLFLILTFPFMSLPCIREETNCGISIRIFLKDLSYILNGIKTVVEVI